ncbi:hypothetical protein [Azoarcus taiwanensis]|uniref:hypothetical protein n=1 Tax=Azoarcus taiwanensis TaxID=666964 RepID=UPI0030D92019
MAPGEWRNLAHLTTWPGKDEGVSFKSFQYVVPIDGESGGADGMGWTQQLVEHDGKLMMILSRSQFERALMVMEADGRFWRINQPEGFDSNAGHPGGRRPFNRLTKDDDYLYFAPSDSPRTEMGWFIRTPLDNPGVFERVGPSFGDTQVDGVGSFAITYVQEWGRFYAYTPGGKIWSRAPEDNEWHLHERLPRNDDGRRLSGYAGLLLWNSVKRELAIVGGQNFGSRLRTSYMQYRMTEPFGAPELMADRVGPDGERMLWGSGSSKLIVDPRDGSYLFLKSNVLYRAPDLASPYTVYEDLTGSLPFGRYEPYCPFALVPGTDVIAFISHTQGLVLHRLKPLVAEAPARKPGDEAVESENKVTGQPMPQPARDLPIAPALAQSAIGQLAASTQPGEVAEIPGVAFPPGHANFRAWFTQSSQADVWGDVAHWHPDTASIYFQGLNQSNVFFRYDALRNEWSELPLEGGPVKETNYYHVYNKIALDPKRGHYYRLWLRGSRQNALLRYVIAQRRWEFAADPMPLAPVGSSSALSFVPLEWHSGLDRLVMVRNRRAWAIDPARPDALDGYTDLGPIEVHGYHSTSRYNVTRGDMLVAGGTYSPRKASLIAADGSIAPVADLPFDHRISNDNLLYDPVSGAYLIYRAPSRELWELSADLTEWSMVRVFDQEVWRGRYAGVRTAPIPELGAIFIQTEHGARLYKHSSNGTDATIARPTPPKAVPPPIGHQPENPSPSVRASRLSQPVEAPSGIRPEPAAHARDLSPAMIRAIRNR